MYRILAVLLLLSSAHFASAGPGVIGRAKHPVKGSYIVVLNDLDSTRPAARAVELAKFFGGRVMAVWDDAVNGFAVELSDSQALALSHSPLVKAIEEDGYGTVIATQPTGSSLWGLDRIDQHTLPTNGSYNYCQDGTGVNIYIVDTGVWYLHNEFDLLTGGSNRVERGMDFVDCPSGCSGGQAFQPCNAGGEVINGAISSHGTEVASVAAGLNYGVAKNATIIPVRAANCFGGLTSSSAISAVNWVKTDHDAGELAVMNCSFVFDSSSAPTALTDAINRAIADGIVVVAGAGNENQSANNVVPANIPGVITVGATDRLDQRWVQSATVGSNRGPRVDLFAPGKSISVATIYSVNSMIVNGLGTSMAAPFVSGVVAQFLQYNPTATPDQVHAWVVANATPGVIDPGSLPPSTPNLLLYSSCN